MSRQKSLAAGVIRIPWKSATVIPTRKHTISSVFLERFLPPVITPGVLSLTLYSIVIRSDLIQLLHKLIRCNLDVFITLWHFVSNSLNRYLKSAGCIFLDYSFFLDLIPYSLLFRTFDSFGCLFNEVQLLQQKTQLNIWIITYRISSLRTPTFRKQLLFHLTRALFSLTICLLIHMFG